MCLVQLYFSKDCKSQFHVKNYREFYKFYVEKNANSLST